MARRRPFSARRKPTGSAKNMNFREAGRPAQKGSDDRSLPPSTRASRRRSGHDRIPQNQRESVGLAGVVAAISFEARDASALETERIAVSHTFAAPVSLPRGSGFRTWFASRALVARRRHYSLRGGFAVRIAPAVGLLLMIAHAALAQDYRPDFKPETMKPPSSGRANEVLILGSPHLSAAPPTFKASMLAPLLDRLTAWSPTAVATEEMSGLQCDALRRNPARYVETVETYCPDSTPAAHATGLSVPAANAEAERLLASWPAAPSAADRRRLAAVFLAAGERYSALVQWLRLPSAERRIGNGLTVELVRAVFELETRPNESGLVGAVLAARLGLERVWSIDDHSADTLDSPDTNDRKAYDDAIAKAWDNPSTKAWQLQAKRLIDGLASPNGVLATYRGLNAPTIPMLSYRGDVGPALVEPSPQQFGRGYVGYWETRNLRMSANIRDVLAHHPGTRMLAVVGASHKGYLEAYLDQMHDVRLVSAEAVLR